MYFFIYFLFIMQFEPILQKSFLVFNHREKIVKMRRRLYVVRVGCISEEEQLPNYICQSPLLIFPFLRLNPSICHKLFPKIKTF